MESNFDHFLFQQNAADESIIKAFVAGNELKISREFASRWRGVCFFF